MTARPGPALAVLLGACTALFPYDEGGERGPRKKDAGGQDEPPREAGPEAGLDAAPCPGDDDVDDDGDGHSCDDCDDADPTVYPRAPWGAFTFVPFDEADNHFDVQVDEDGTVVVAFADANDDVLLSTKNGGGWGRFSVADAVGNARHIDLAGPPGQRAVCFWDEGFDRGPLRVWTETGGLVDIEGDHYQPGPFCAVAVDRARTTHLVYYDTSTGHIRHRREGAGLGWTDAPIDVATVAPLGGELDYWSRVSLTLDPDDRPWAAFRDDLTGHVLVYDFDGLAWRTGTTSFEGRHPMIGFFGRDQPHLCFHDEDEDRMAYALRGASGAWTRELLGGQLDLDMWCSIERHDEQFVIAWEQRASESEEYEGRIARRMADDDWDIVPLPLAGEDRTRRPHLAGERGGKLHAVYVDNQNGDLKHGVLHEDCPR